MKSINKYPSSNHDEGNTYPSAPKGNDSLLEYSEEYISDMISTMRDNGWD